VCIFQSEQVINLRFWHKKLIFKSYTQLNFVDEKAMWTPAVTKLLPNLSKTASISCRTTSSFSKMAHLLTQQLLPKTGSRRNALVSLEKNEWPPNSPDLNPLDYRVCAWGAMLHGTLWEIHAKADQHCRAEDCLAIDMKWFSTGVHW